MIEKTENKTEVFPLIRGLDRYYPSILSWFDNLDLNGQAPALVYRNKGRAVGVCLGKKAEAETKIRCLRVHPGYRNEGLGIRLMDRMIELLEERKPLVTVSEELLHQYSRAFVRRYGFSLDEVSKGMYRRGRLEYVFNGV